MIACVRVDKSGDTPQPEIALTVPLVVDRVDLGVCVHVCYSLDVANQEGVPARLPGEVREGLRSVAPLITPVPVVVVLDILARHKPLHAAYRPIGSISQFHDICRDEVDPLGNTLGIELTRPLSSFGLHFDVIKVLNSLGGSCLGHFGDEMRLFARSCEIPHVECGAHGTLRKRSPLDDDIDEGTPPLSRVGVVFMLDGLFCFCDIEIVCVNVLWELKLWHREGLLVRHELFHGRTHPHLGQCHQAGG
mmetsp:Transcript_5618/g.10920  ORF Transcript_5618/g.10920 Transcript_5618/m.10920 type:complete len:248 (+) Transcript_5618:544-1287(+)